MKKIVVLLLVIVTVVLSVPVSAASSTLSDIIHDEIIQLIDIKQYGADENDEGIYLISVMESGYTEKGFSDQTALYVYLYNPSMKKITSSDLNAISMATEYNEDGKPVDFKKYRLQVEGSTSGGLYIRAKVAASAKTLAHVKDGVRWYGVSELELVDSKSYDVEAYTGGIVYKFSGYGSDLKCERESFLTLELEVGHTSYLTGNSSKGVGYSNQIASVYFSIPQEIEQKYGKLYGVKYEYYKYRTAPIMLFTENIYPAADENPENFASFFSIQICKMVGSHGAAAPQWQYYCDAPLLGFLIDEYVIGKELVSSSRLKEGFENVSRMDKLTPSRLLHEKYSKSLFDLSVYGENNYKVTEYKTREEMFSMDSYGETHGFLDKLLNFGLMFGKYNLDENVENAKFIQPVTSGSLFDSDFSTEYLVAEEDVSTLATYVLDAEKKNQNTYLLRFAYTDSYHVTGGSDYRLVYDDPFETFNFKYSDVWLVEQDVYLNFNILKLDFSDDGQDVTTFGVVMAPIDIFPSLGGIATGGGDDVDLKGLLQKIVAVILIVVFVGVVIWIIGLFGELGQASTNRQILRELRRRKKK